MRVLTLTACLAAAISGPLAAWGGGANNQNDFNAPGEGVGSLPFTAPSLEAGLLLFGTREDVFASMHSARGAGSLEWVAFDAAQPEGEGMLAVQGNVNLTLSRAELEARHLVVGYFAGAGFQGGDAQIRVSSGGRTTVPLEALALLEMPVGALYAPQASNPPRLGMVVHGLEGTLQHLRFSARGDELLVRQRTR
jgi:hypothetical protein